MGYLSLAIIISIVRLITIKDRSLTFDTSG